MRAALCGRVSTVDKGEDVERQLRDLPTYATPREWEISLRTTLEIKDFPLDLSPTLHAPKEETATITQSVEPVTSAPPLDPGLAVQRATQSPSITPTPPQRNHPSDHHVTMAADGAWAGLGTNLRLRRP